MRPERLDAGERYIYAFWHENLLLPAYHYGRPDIQVLISQHATAVRLVLFEDEGEEIAAEIPLAPALYRTGFHWHVRIGGLPDEFCYGYRVAGPSGEGHRFDPALILLDPTARALSFGRPWGVGGPRPRRP